MSEEAINTLRICEEALTSTGDDDLIMDRLESVLEDLRIYRTENIRRACRLIERAIVLLANPESSHGSGRPRYSITKCTLEYMLSLNFKIPSIANMMGVSKRTINRRLRDYGLSVTQTYTDIDDDDLQRIMTDIILNHPNTGFKRMRGYLSARGIKVTTMRILHALRTVDPIGVETRRSLNRIINRRVYSVAYSNEIWHIDTHHKLIRWGIVIRGGIDGKSRTITYLDAGNDNTAFSNYYSFMQGVTRYGVPIRTRSDKGGENVDIARFMIATRGIGRGSHICGRSVHNQRIERLWRDVHYGCLHSFRNLFVMLEDEGLLNTDNPKHLAVLQYIFVPRIQRSLREFMDSWNSHPISSEQNRTPAQIMFASLPPSEYDMTIPAPSDLDAGDQPDMSGFEESPVLTLEDFSLYLSHAELHDIQLLNPLAESNSFGYDLYMEGLQVLRM